MLLPVAALLLRFGQPDLLNVPFIAQAGWAIFDNLALIFAIGVASSWSMDNAGSAALAGAVGYFVMTKAMVTINPEINMDVLVGIIGPVWWHRRYTTAGPASSCRTS
ncbi:PTS transporter subunit EIIC [Klebsiella pneumoniae]|nr:PTS transporter subunit EIIC [Klebsiella pneumoniae]